MQREVIKVVLRCNRRTTTLICLTNLKHKEAYVSPQMKMHLKTRIRSYWKFLENQKDDDNDDDEDDDDDDDEDYCEEEDYNCGYDHYDDNDDDNDDVHRGLPIALE